ncbi:MAG: hypothetical protein FWH04_07530 [Oscillospiraceae bacterium]|nr:hypothetical protein [Oscillospiraceae bacterium]
MKHADAINKIIDAEHQAQMMTEEAKAKKECLEEETRQNIENMSHRYYADAEKEIAAFREREEALTQSKIKELSKTHRAEMENMEFLFREHREEWVETIFKKVIEL